MVWSADPFLESRSSSFVRCFGGRDDSRIGGGMRRVSAAVGISTIMAAACTNSFEVDCTLVDVFPYSIVVEVTFPAQSVEPLPQPTGMVTAERFSDGMMLRVGNQLVSDAPSGTYDVSVTAAGFEEWTRTQVQTSTGVCGGFDPIDLTAELVPPAP